jgi:hypothetical protein
VVGTHVLGPVQAVNSLYLHIHVSTRKNRIKAQARQPDNPAQQ